MNRLNPGLIIDPNRTHRLRLSLGNGSYSFPAHIDRRPELLSSSNQGETSECVAYAVAGWLEYFNWRYYGIARQIDPHPIYVRAKELDGLAGEGTTLEAGLQAARDLKLLSNVDDASIRNVENIFEAKQALHRYGVVLSAFQVTDNWFKSVEDGWIQPGGNPVGGHAVVVCGYSSVDDPQWFGIQNSWGDHQGWRGFNRLSPELFAQQFVYGLVWNFKTALPGV